MISRCTWGWARNYASIPHEYIARNRCPLRKDEFEYFVHAQRDLGIKEQWREYNFPYLYIDGFKYWTMGDTIPRTIIINRQKNFKEFDMLNWPLERPYTEEENEAVCGTIIDNFDKPIFEAGLGNGDFVKSMKVSPERYYGVDPSSYALDRFRKETTGYYKRCSCRSFEEACEKWRSEDSVVVALFGTASYFMKEYLRMLSDSGRDYFLMFFNDFMPDCYRGTHIFDYKKDDIISLFPNCVLYNHEKYIIISSKKLVWRKKKPRIVQNELFPV